MGADDVRHTIRVLNTLDKCGSKTAMFCGNSPVFMRLLADRGLIVEAWHDPDKIEPAYRITSKGRHLVNMTGNLLEILRAVVDMQDLHTYSPDYDRGNGGRDGVNHYTIAVWCGRETCASDWAHYGLKKLLDRGFIEVTGKNKTGSRTYAPTDEGRNVYEMMVGLK